MASPLLSYSEAAEQVHRFIVAMAAGEEIPLSPGVAGASGPFGLSGLPHPPTPDVFAAPRPPSSEFIPLSDAPGRILAGEIRADRDQPPFARSTRDGFACRSAEANTHQFLFLAGRVRAGEAPAGALNAGEIWEIMTGAPVPPGADCVLMVEHAEQSSNFVRLPEPRTVQPGENIVAQGAEARAGDLLVPAGVRITPAQIAIAAQCGLSVLEVSPRPRVAILSTGDELVSVDQVPGLSQIRNSNAPMLAALVTTAGGTPIVLPAAPDRPDAIDEALAQILSPSPGIDLLLITGGISVGKFDLVEDALTRAGARFFFGGVAIQPGKPVVFGQLPRLAELETSPGRLVPVAFFALPGNPISSAVTFHLFAAPLLAALAGDTGPQPRFALAELKGQWRGKPGLTRFLPAWCDFAPTPGIAPEVRLVPWQGSGDIAAFARCNCFLVIPAESSELIDGSIVQILLT